jgi:hypothetical protein
VKAHFSFQSSRIKRRKHLAKNKWRLQWQSLRIVQLKRAKTFGTTLTRLSPKPATQLILKDASATHARKAELPALPAYQYSHARPRFARIVSYQSARVQYSIGNGCMTLRTNPDATNADIERNLKLEILSQ